MLKIKIIFLVFLFIVPLVFFVKCAKKEIKERRYLLERVGDFQVLQVYADGFENLSKKDKILSYYLSMASLAGRDINYDQNQYFLKKMSNNSLIHAIHSAELGFCYELKL